MNRFLSFIIPAIGDIAIMCWILTELWDTDSTRKGRLLMLGIVFLGWEALHKLIKPKRFRAYSKIIWSLFILLAIGFWIYGENVIRINQNTPKKPPFVTIVDSIPHTHFTYNQLQDMFPFGYTIYFANRDEIVFLSSSYETDHWGMINWGSAWVHPDFSTGMLTCAPPNTTTSPNNNIARNGKGILPMATGHFYPIDVHYPGLPDFYAGMIGGDQKNWVIVIGIRYGEYESHPKKNPTPINGIGTNSQPILDQSAHGKK
jgi:hypothetical protein